jgi:hypothetical protein
MDTLPLPLLASGDETLLPGTGSVDEPRICAFPQMSQGPNVGYATTGTDEWHVI